MLQKWPFFHLFFLGNLGYENVFYDILERENAFLGYKNTKFKKSKNWHFSRGVNPGFWSKNGHLSNFFFRQYSPGNCLSWYSRTKKRRSRLWKQEVQKVKKFTFFQRGWPRVLLQKMAIFPTYSFLGNISSENVFYDILEQKHAVLGYKNKNFKKPKNWHFFKRVNPWFCFKNGHFSNFFF